MRLRNIMILFDKPEPPRSKSYLRCYFHKIEKRSVCGCTKKIKGKKGARGNPESLLFLSNDPVPVSRESGWSNVEPLFATALINSARYLWAQKTPWYFRIEMEQWWWRRRRRKEEDGEQQQGGEEEKRGKRDHKKTPLIIPTSAKVIAQVIYAWWINAQPTAQVNIVTDLNIEKKNKTKSAQYTKTNQHQIN